MPNTPLPTTNRPGPSWRLIALTAVVLLAHWAVLRAAPLALAAHASQQASPGWAFSTRTIAPADTSGEAVVATKQVATKPAPRPRPPSVQPPPAENPASAQGMDENTAPALGKYEVSAIETIASVIPTPLPPDEAPTLLAAAAPVAQVVDAASNAAAPTRATPLAATAVQKFAFPPSTRLKYDVKGEIKGFPYHVNGELLWTQDGKTYDARMEISHFLLGSRVQTSTGQLTVHGLEPTRFGDKVRSEVAAHFDREKNKVTFSANTPDVPLLPGAQDQLSVLVQLASMLGAEPKRFPKATTLPFQAIGPRSSESWVFTVDTLEKLSLPGGELNAVRLWRDPSGEYDPRVEIWLAPDLGYLPVRIRLTQANGDVVDQQWRATVK